MPTREFAARLRRSAMSLLKWMLGGGTLKALKFLRLSRNPSP
jgi:hypothetical protein